MNPDDSYSTFNYTIIEHCGYRPGEKVLAALSGGPDSVCMLLMLKKFLPDGSLGAAHFNHMIRAGESDGDEEFSRKLSEKLDVPFFAGRANILEAAKKEGTGIEECAREYRYRFLKKTALDNGYDLICVGHNLNDNAETILMHIFRGCSLDGLCGLAYRSDNIIRPLLDIDRGEIIEYLSSAGQLFVTDSSNKDVHYMRNRLRNDIIPYISKRLGYDVSRVLVRQTPFSTSERDCLESLAKEYIDKNIIRTGEGNIILAAGSFSKLHPSVARRVLRHVIATVSDSSGNLPYKGRKDIVSDVVERAFNAIRSGKKGRSIQLGRSVVMRITHSGAVFSCDDEKCIDRRTVRSVDNGDNASDRDASAPIRYPELLATELSGEETEAEKLRSGFRADNFTVFFDKAKYIDIINAHGGKAPVMRNPEPGDVIMPFGMQGSKKVQKLLIDMKIPLERRRNVVLLATDAEVLWIPGICSSEKLRITHETQNVLRINIQGEEQNE